jgi:hypothetical protein
MSRHTAARESANGRRSLYLVFEHDRPPLPETKVEEPDWTAQRKAIPLNDLLNPTLRWAASLPIAIRPFGLMNRFPRLANLIAASWKEPLAFRACLDDLLTDRRGGRQGLPEEVREELDHLRRYYYFREIPSSKARPAPVKEPL